MGEGQYCTAALLYAIKLYQHTTERYSNGGGTYVMNKNV